MSEKVFSAKVETEHFDQSINYQDRVKWSLLGAVRSRHLNSYPNLIQLRTVQIIQYLAFEGRIIIVFYLAVGCVLYG